MRRKPIPQRWLKRGLVSCGLGYWEMGARRKVVDHWKEGARRGEVSDLCPACGLAGVLTFDFKKFGQHRMVECPTCGAIYVDGQKAADVTVQEA